MSGLFLAVAGVIALGLSLVKSLFEIRKAQGDDNSNLPAALRGARLWLLVAAVSAVLLVAGAVDWWQTRPTYIITTRLFNVSADTKHDQLEALEFFGNGTDPSDEILSQIQQWADQKLRLDQGVTDQPVKARMVISADLATEGITVEMDPPGPFELIGSFQGPGGKSQVPLTQALLASGTPFVLELRRPGYEIWSQEVSPGSSQDISKDLVPVRVRLGIEDFAGRDTLASRLAVKLGATFQIVDPASLKVLAERIKQEKLDVSNSVIQQSYRSSLGVDYILGGGFEAAGGR